MSSLSSSTKYTDSKDRCRIYNQYNQVVKVSDQTDAVGHWSTDTSCRFTEPPSNRNSKGWVRWSGAFESIYLMISVKTKQKNSLKHGKTKWQTNDSWATYVTSPSNGSCLPKAMLSLSTVKR
jgi:hypothetical protein